MVLVILSVAVFLSTGISLSYAAATIEPLDGSVCLGQRAQWTCTANNSLGWQLERVGQPSSPVNIFYVTPDTDETRPEQPLGSGIQTIVTFIRGTVYNSKATAANVTTSLNGTRLSCTESGVFGDPRVDITIKDPASISYVDVEEKSATEVIVTWDGAECVDYYVIECGAYRNTTTSERLVIKPGNNCFSCVVSGINFLGQNFTSLSTDFCFTMYKFNFQTVVDDSNLYIVIEAMVTNQPLITSCSVSLNATEKSCSETDKVVRFDVKPGSYYQYSIAIRNIIGLSYVNRNISIPTTTPPPTVPPPDKCDIWCILFFIIAAALVISNPLLVACLCLMRICIFERRKYCLKCQNSSKWRRLFCYKGFAATEVATDTDKKKLEDKTSSL